ncbi:MAG: lipocalin [Porticoccaceae bacterium]|jgi:apolipoprotein D and lipocalin family protein|nr:lipocalin [Porticoccaceae bacterium]MBT5577382.1 lipocalin [Porticoccaceae bacterium]MBT7374932.1 lipocalin [Porticoccaceae bacterium]
MRLPLICILYLCLAGCLGAPDNVVPVKEFELDRYLGQWYEIARLDHSFERGLDAVSANYSLRDDGGIRVLNSGVERETGALSQAEGRAYFVEDSSTGYLKVSFFGPFYGSYIIFDLDPDGYEYAFVAGNSTDYLWLLARSPQVSDELMANFVNQAETLGFDVGNLIVVNHQVN